MWSRGSRCKRPPFTERDPEAINEDAEPAFVPAAPNELRLREPSPSCRIVRCLYSSKSALPSFSGGRGSEIRLDSIEPLVQHHTA